jgi:hypothetical protein
MRLVGGEMERDKTLQKEDDEIEKKTFFFFFFFFFCSSWSEYQHPTPGGPTTKTTITTCDTCIRTAEINSSSSTNSSSIDNNLYSRQVLFFLLCALPCTLSPWH